MDIINTQKQQESKENAECAAQLQRAREAEERHRARVAAGEELLGITKPEPVSNPKTQKKPVSPKRVPKQPRTAATPHLWRRRILATLATFGVFAFGAAAYVGFKAYSATSHMQLTRYTSSTAATKIDKTDTSEAASETDTKKVEVIDITLREDDHSFVRDTLSAAGALVGKRTPLTGEDTGYVNILLLGKGTEDHPGKDLTDTIMLARIDVDKGRIGLLSLPRDMYVMIPGTKSATKINALYNYGLRNNLGAAPIVDAVEDVTDLDVHYFLVVDFDAFTSVVDALGGINVDVQRDILDRTYPGPNYSYEVFELDAGLQHLDGATALKYVRTRHNDPEGDFGRAKRQQQTLQAIKNKAFSLGTLSNPLRLGEIFDALGDHIRTNISFADMTSLVALLPQLDTQNITTVVVDAWKADSLLRVDHVGAMFVLVPRAGRFDYTEIRDSAHTIFDRIEHDRILAEVAREKPTVVISRAGASYATAQRVRTLIADSLGLRTSAISITSSTDQHDDHARIIDHADTRTPFTLTALFRTLGTQQITENSDSKTKADITVVLGSDADDFFAVSSVSQEEFEAADTASSDRVMIQTIN